MGKLYHVVVKVLPAASYEISEINCETLSGSLVRVENALHNRKIAEMAPWKNGYIGLMWIGYSDTVQENHFKDYYDTYPKFTNWGVGKDKTQMPDNKGRQTNGTVEDQDCTVINFRKLGYWDDTWQGCLVDTVYYNIT